MEALVAPHDESVHLVNEWLASHGLYEDSLSRSPARDWVHIKVPVSLAEDMLKTVRLPPLHRGHRAMQHVTFWLHCDYGPNMAAIGQGVASWIHFDYIAYSKCNQDVT